MAKVEKMVVKLEPPKKSKKLSKEQKELRDAMKMSGIMYGKDTSALERIQQAPPGVVMHRAQEALAALGSIPSELAPAERAEVLVFISQAKKLLESTEKVHKDAVKAEVLAAGKVVTEAGTKRLERDGFSWEIRPTKTGYDPKKVEAGLRAQGLNPAEHMTTEVSYSVDVPKLDALVAAEKLTADELKDWKYDPSWAVQPPKKLEE